MTKKHYLRKNNVMQAREVGKKGNVTRTWYRSKAAADGWREVGKEAAAQLDVELKEKRLTQIPDKLVDENREAWLKFLADKPRDVFDEKFL